MGVRVLYFTRLSREAIRSMGRWGKAVRGCQLTGRPVK
jgi:hypothetical protein